MKTAGLAALLGLCLTALPLQADSWRLPPEVKDTNYVFGATRIILRYDSTRDSLYPEYTVTVKHRGKTPAIHPGVGFEQLFASPDHAYFLGVSNSGLTKDAYVLFDAEGKLLKRQPHDPTKVHYRAFSISLIRRWYDPVSPAASFAITNGVLRDVTIHDCDGKPVSLLREATPGPAQAQ